MSERTSRATGDFERGAAERGGAARRSERARTVRGILVIGIALALAAPALPALAQDKKPAKADRKRVRKDARAAEERTAILPSIGPGGAQVTLRVHF